MAPAKALLNTSHERLFNIYVTVGWIDGHLCWIEQALMAGVLRSAFAGAIRRVENSASSNLHQEFPVVTVLLDDAVIIAADPDIVLPVKSAAMDGVRDHVGISPGRDHVSRKIKHDDRRRLLRCLRFFLRDV